MRGYIISIAGAAVIAAAMNMLSPDKWQKYTGVVTGLVVALCIARPIFALTKTDALGGLRFSDPPAAERSEVYYDEVKAELELRLNGDIKSRLKTEFDTDCEVHAEAAQDKSGIITGIRRISVYGGHLDNAAAGRLREVYGAEEVVFGGDK